jgi:DNA-binding PadR family transcriptional regulator
VAAKHLVLGVLAASETHGYAIQRTLLATLGPCFAIPAARVYALLNEMESAGLISVRSGAGTRRAPRRSFRIEPAGREEYRRWLSAPTSCNGLLRSELLVKLTLALELSLETVPAIVAGERAARVRMKMDLHRRLARLEEVPEETRAREGAPRGRSRRLREESPASPRLLERLELERVLRHLQVELDSLEEIEGRARALGTAARDEPQPAPALAFDSARAMARAFR